MELTKEQILTKIKNYEKDKKPRLDNLYKYYRGEHDILKTTKPKGKPNNKLVINYPKNIVNNTTGYYLGIPVKYSSKDEILSEQVQEITEYNDDAFHNMKIGKNLSVYGLAAEVLYLDSDAEIRYANINPSSVIADYSDDVEHNIIRAIRWYDITDDNANTVRHIEQYTDKEVIYYHQQEDSELIEDNRSAHYFNDIPINIYENNDDGLGDFEDVISLVDAYNVMQSESVNDFQKFADALLAIKNVCVDEEVVKSIRDNNILELQGDSTEAGWLVKSVNDTYVENIKNRLEKDIYMASATVNMSDDNFANNASGVAIKYKLMCMENRVSVTERNFKKALQRRFELICNVLNIKGGNYDYKTIDIAFNRNIPANIQEVATTIQQLDGIVSKKTLLNQIPFIDNVDEEVEAVEKELSFGILDGGTNG